MTKEIIVYMITAAIFVAPCYANAKNITFVGEGDTICADFTILRRSEEREKQLNSWIDGYISAYNLYASAGTGNVSEGASSDDLHKAVANSCISYPDAKLAIAVSNVIGNLIVLRLQKQMELCGRDHSLAYCESH